MLLLLALVPSASAFDDASLRSDTTFGLFRDPYDYLPEPATLASQEGRHVYTTLGNLGGGDTFTIGGLGEAGPGVVGAIAEYGRDGAKTTSTETSATTPETVTRSRTSLRTTTWSGLLSYGADLGGSLSVGATAEWWEQSTLATAAPNPGGPPSIGGSLQNTTIGGEDSLVETGSATQRLVDGRAAIGAAYGSPRVDVEADFTLSRASRSTTLADVYLKKGTEEYSADGFPEGTSILLNYAGTLPGLRIDATGHVSDHLDVRLLAEASRGSAKPAVDERFEGYSDDAQADLDWSVDEALSKPKMTMSTAHVLLAGHVAADGTLVRFGVEWTGDSQDFAVTSDVTSDFAGASTDVAWRQEDVARYGQLALPVAVEVPVGDRWTLRGGGRFSETTSRLDDTRTLKSDPADGDTTDLGAVQRQAGDTLQLSGGFRFTPVHWFTLDAGTFASAATGRVRLDVSSLYVSGIFHL